MVSPPKISAPSTGAGKPKLAALRAALPLCLALAVMMLLLTALPSSVAAQNNTLRFITIKRGFMDPTVTGDTLYGVLEGVHGTATENRGLEPNGIELDIYSVSNARFGLGLGIEIAGYRKVTHYPDGEVFTQDTKSVMFNLKTILRAGAFQPYVGLGFGNYYMTLQQQVTPLRFRDRAPTAYSFRTGVRWLLGRSSLVLEAGQTAAMLSVETWSGSGTLELGGFYGNVGLSWLW